MQKNIKKLESLLLPEFLNINQEVTSYETKYFTAPGENYASVLLAIDISIKEIKNGKKSILHCVAKTVPQNDFIRFFISSIAFKKELGLYNTVMPTMKQFQVDQGMEKVIDFVANFYGGRLSLNPSLSQADEDAVILMENLKLRGYTTVDRRIGFDFETVCLIIKDLATFHAVPIALKIKRPEIFKTSVLPFLEVADVFQSLTEDMRTKMIEDIINTAQGNTKCHPYLTSIKKKCEHCFHIFNGPNKVREPFATLTHNDLWVNNTLIKFADGKPVRNKIIDFQFIGYNSPAKDLIFLIFDSVQNEIIKKHYDTMIKLYFDEFISTLKNLNVDPEKFSYSDFLEEIDYAADNTFLITQCLIMVRPIFAVKETTNEVENLSPENLVQHGEPSEGHKEKMYFLVEEFAKRKWL